MYRSVAGRTADAELRAQYEQFGAEIREHVERLEQLIAAADGDPQYVSAAARATEKAGAGLLESTYLLDGSMDPMTAELVMLEAVMLAEAKDHSNWELLAQLASAMTDGTLRRRMETVTKEVLAQEEQHYRWAHDTRARLLLTLAGAGSGVTNTSPQTTKVDDRTRDELYAQAQEMNIPGRSPDTPTTWRSSGRWQYRGASTPNSKRSSTG
jgi:rubrerythrin